MALYHYGSMGMVLYCYGVMVLGTILLWGNGTWYYTVMG